MSLNMYYSHSVLTYSKNANIKTQKIYYISSVCFNLFIKDKMTWDKNMCMLYYIPLMYQPQWLKFIILFYIFYIYANAS